MTRPAISGYPVNLVVAGRRCVVVGAGRIAARKIDALLAAGATTSTRAPASSSGSILRDAMRPAPTTTTRRPRTKRFTG